MRFILKDKKTGSTIDEYYLGNVYIGLDGKPYELDAASGSGGDVWLSTTDLSNEYDVYLLGVDVSLN